MSGWVVLLALAGVVVAALRPVPTALVAMGALAGGARGRARVRRAGELNS